MGFLDLFFGKKQPAAPQNRQLPSNMVAAEFGEVNVKPSKEGNEIMFTILMEPEGVEAEGWQTGVALDASVSMLTSYGHGLTVGPKGNVPQSLLQEYARKGWVEVVTRDGAQRVMWSNEASRDACERGYMQETPNVVQPVSREFIAYLAGNLDADGGTTVIYWACGGDGRAYEVIGDFTTAECADLILTGPKTVGFGGGTHLTPAVKYFVDRFADAARGMYLFVTDGKLDDLAEVKRYTTDLARKIQAKKHNSVKCVLIGIGEDVDEGQMEELDDLDTGTDVDIWDHKIAKEMRSLVEIFAEVVSENKIVAPTAVLFDDAGNIVTRFADGLPAKVTFTLPAGRKGFELEVGERRIKQSIAV